MATRILNQLQEACGEELALVRGDLGRLEQALGAMLKSLGVGLLQRLVDQSRNGYQGPCVACTCGGWMRFVGHRPRAIHTLFGWITVRRAYYCCARCGRSKVPYDEAGGLGSEQLSPALAKVCCLLAVDDSFGAVEGACKHVVGKRLKQSGMIWTRAGSSATLALRICWLNEQWDSFWQQKPLAA